MVSPAAFEFTVPFRVAVAAVIAVAAVVVTVSATGPDVITAPEATETQSSEPYETEYQASCEAGALAAQVTPSVLVMTRSLDPWEATATNWPSP